MNKLFHTSPTPAAGNQYALADKNHPESHRRQSQKAPLNQNHLQEVEGNWWNK